MRPLARKALEAIQEQGGRVIDRDRIESTLKEIGKEYRPGLIGWIKGNPDRWARLLELEHQINEQALTRDGEKLNEALNQYQGFFTQTGEDFKTPKGEIGNLFEGGVLNGQEQRIA